MKTVTALVVLWFVSGLAWGSLPENWTLAGQSEQKGGWLVAAMPSKLTAPLAGDTMTQVTLRCGAIDRKVTCDAAGVAGPSLHLELTARDDEYRVGIVGKEVIPLPDACLELRLNQPGYEIFRDRYYVRPYPHWYEGADRKRVLEGWAQLPSASTHEVLLGLETRGNLVRVWVDGRCLGGTVLDRPASLTFALPAGVALKDATVSPLPADAAYLPLNLLGYRRPAPWTNTDLPVQRGDIAANGVPFHVGGLGDEIDVGVSRWLAEETGPEEYTDNYYTRSAFDNRPEDILLAVPSDDYSSAHFLCTVDPDPAKTPVIALRLTRYLKDYYDSGGRGDGIADSTIRLEKTAGKWPSGCREVGMVQVQTDAGPRRLPLLQVSLPLHGGQIQDVLEEKGLFIGRGTGYLELELTKDLHDVETANHGAYSTKPLGRPSGVQLYALTLQRAPVQVRLRSRRIGNVFYRDERPAVDLETQSLQKAGFSGKLSWRITDAEGRSTSGERTVSVPAAADPVKLPVDLQQPRYGWFQTSLTLRDSAGRPVWDTVTTFAILPPDTRKAGSESPYGIWWFGKSHVGTDSLEQMAPLLQRLGYRHICPRGSYPGQGEELAKYGLSLSMFSNYITRKEAGLKALDEAVAANPKVGWDIVFHENGFGESIEFPPEFLGKPAPKLTEDQQQKFKEMYDQAVGYAKYVRAKYPHVKLILGNGSLPFAVEFVRQGFPREYVDAFGDEDLGQQFPPEAPPQAFKSVFWMRQYAKQYKYDVPITTTYEWRGRGTNPGNLSELEQAQLYSRDLLQCLAYNMPHINAGLLHDVGDAYFYSRWGSGGVCHRYPMCNPKISYVALSTLTRELDQAKFRRYLDTGSPSVYAEEFSRPDGMVYALWLPRGERRVSLDFGRDTSFSLTDMNGNTQKLQAPKGKATINLSVSPCYLATGTPITISPDGPTICEPPPAKPKAIDSLISLDQWEVATEPEKALEGVHFDFPRKLGAIAVSVTPDMQKKQALQLALRPDPDTPWPVARYVVLRAKTPAPVPGRPTSVGVWVKGNSSWGRVFWEFEDAKGERFLSIGAPCGGWSVGDWRCKTFLSFDGWNYLREPLPFKYESGFYGPPQSEWTATGGDGLVDYPIKLTRLMVELRDKVVHLTDPIEVPDKSVRLRDLSVGYEPTGR
jgi:hypothetical protein